MHSRCNLFGLFMTPVIMARVTGKKIIMKLFKEEKNYHFFYSEIIPLLITFLPLIISLILFFIAIILSR